MQFVINTSLEPFGCALIQDNKIIDQNIWEDFKKAGESTWAFLEKHKKQWKEIQFIGGVSGPGGFSNLRVSGVILNALSLKLDLPIYQVRADKVVKALLKAEGVEAEFILNSFGDAVFCVDGESLIRTERKTLLEEKARCVEFLPVQKQQGFTNTISVPKTKLYLIISQELQQTKPQKIFIPDYEYPPVQ